MKFNYFVTAKSHGDMLPNLIEGFATYEEAVRARDNYISSEKPGSVIIFDVLPSDYHLFRRERQLFKMLKQIKKLIREKS